MAEGCHFCGVGVGVFVVVCIGGDGIDGCGRRGTVGISGGCAGAIISVGSVHVLGRIFFRVFVRNRGRDNGVAVAIKNFGAGSSVSDTSAGGVAAGGIWNVITGVVVAVGVSGGVAVLIERD